MSNSPAAVRPTTLADAAHVARWVSSPEELLVFAGPKLTFPLQPQALLDTAGDGWHVRSLVVNSHLVGTGSFTLRDGAVHLGRLLVDPGQRGQGLGTLLVTELLEHARLHSPELARCLRVTLNVFEDNLPARRLYESLGFSVAAESVHDGRPALVMTKELRPDIEHLALMTPRIMERHPLVQWLMEPGDDDRPLRLHLRVAGDPRRVALLDVLPTASVYLGCVAGAATGPDFADQGDEEVEGVFTDYIGRLCSLLLGPTTVRQAWRGDRWHSAHVTGSREGAGDSWSGEIFGLRRRVLSRLGVQFEQTTLHFPADVASTGWRPGDPVEHYPLNVPDSWWKIP